MMQSCDLDAFNGMPGFKIVLKAVIRSQIQQLVQQLYSHTRDECVVLSVNAEEGVFCSLGSESGQHFMRDNTDILSKFLDFCTQNQGTSKENLTHTGPSTSPVKTLRDNLPSSRPKLKNPVVSLVRTQPYTKSRPVRKSSRQKSKMKEPGAQNTKVALIYEEEGTKAEDVEKDYVKPIVTLTGTYSETIKADHDGDSDNNVDAAGIDDDNDGDADNDYGADDTDEYSSDIGEQISEIVRKNRQSDSLDDSSNGYLRENDDDVAENKNGEETDVKLEAPSEGVSSVDENKTEEPSAKKTNQSGSCTLTTDLPSTTKIKDEPGDEAINMKAFQCKECDYSCDRKYNLTRHMKAWHTGRRDDLFVFLCNECGQTFKSKAGLRMHVLNHKGIFQFTCKICQKGFNSKSSFEIHENSHLKIKKYNCNLCSRTYCAQRGLSHHKTHFHGGRKYECNVCEKKFTKLETMKEHKRVSHDGISKYWCIYCGKAFKYRSSLLWHKNKNHLERFFNDSKVTK